MEKLGTLSANYPSYCTFCDSSITLPFSGQKQLGLNENIDHHCRQFCGGFLSIQNHTLVLDVIAL